MGNLGFKRHYWKTSALKEAVVQQEIREWCCSFCIRADNYSVGNRRTVLHEDVMYVILQMIEILHVLCLSLSSH